MKEVDPTIRAAHKHSSRHREELLKSECCGCFHCCKVFPPSAIVEWTDGDTCAFCPECGIDSVIGSASGYPIDAAFLRRMHDHWFS